MCLCCGQPLWASVIASRNHRGTRMVPPPPFTTQPDRHSGTRPARRRPNAQSRTRAAEAASAHDRPHATRSLSLTLAPALLSSPNKSSLTHSRSPPPLSNTLTSHSTKITQNAPLHSLKLRLGLRNTLSPVVSQSVANSTSTAFAATSPPPACFFLLLCAAQMQQQTQQQQMRIAQPTAIPTIRPIMDDWQTL